MQCQEIGSPLDYKALLYRTHKENFRESRRISVRRNEFDSEFLLEFLPFYGRRELRVVAAMTRTNVDFVMIQFLNSQEGSVLQNEHTLL